MIRVIVKIVALGPDGSALETQYRTFPLSHFGQVKDLEEFLLDKSIYQGKTVVGVEVQP